MLDFHIPNSQASYNSYTGQCCNDDDADTDSKMEKLFS